MREIIIGTAVIFVASATLAATREELNLPRDPENLEGAIYGTTVYNLNLRSGPGTEFDVVGLVPGGERVPVIAWLDRRGKKEIWIRARFDGLGGWLCAFQGEERYVEREGGPLFPVAVAAAELRFEYLQSEYPSRWETVWLPRGETVELVSIWGSDFFSRPSGRIGFDVKYGDKLGYLFAYDNEPSPSHVKPGEATGWFVTFPPALLALNLAYDANPLYYYPGEAQKRGQGFYLGPGTAYRRPFSPPPGRTVFFVDGDWALVGSREELAWVDMGTRERPRLRMYRTLGRRELPPPPRRASDEAFEGWYLSGAVQREFWPGRRTLYAELCAATDCTRSVTVDSVAVYQPPEAEAAIWEGAPREASLDVADGYVTLVYLVEVPAPFESEFPFRVVVSLEGYAEGFKMGFSYEPGE